jgi:PPOX class probable F420-dependent enzyme
MSDTALFELLATQHNGVLVTLKRDGRPQLSNITYGFDPATRVVRISVTAGRAKTRNAARDPRISLHVTRPDFGAWVVAEGQAKLSEPARAIDDAATEELVDLYRGIRGEHPDWDEYREAMVAEARVALSFVVERVYGQA